MRKRLHWKNMGIAITQVDAFTSKPFAGNPAAVCILSQAPAEQMDAGCGARDESLGNRVSGSARRRLQPALVHADGRSGSLRPRHAGQRARALGGRASGRGRAGALPHAQRAVARRTARRLDRDGFSGQGRRRPPSRPRILPRLWAYSQSTWDATSSIIWWRWNPRRRCARAQPDHGVLRKTAGARHHRDRALRYA